MVWNLEFSLEALEEPVVGQVLAHSSWVHPPVDPNLCFPQEELGAGGVGCPGTFQMDIMGILQLYFGFAAGIAALQPSRQRHARS